MTHPTEAPAKARTSLCYLGRLFDPSTRPCNPANCNTGHERTASAKRFKQHVSERLVQTEGRLNQERDRRPFFCRAAARILMCAPSLFVSNLALAEPAVVAADASAPLQNHDPAIHSNAGVPGWTSSSSVIFGRAVDLVGAPITAAQTKSVLGGRRVFSWGGPGVLPSGLPVAATGYTSAFGSRYHPILGGLRNHAGIDLAAQAGLPIFATSDGVVSQAQWAGGYGLLVTIEHGDGMQTRYGHMSRIAVAAGQTVRKRDIIGYVGSTGLSTGPHLHYEVRIGGAAVDPFPLLRDR